jgi:hypothetical protein
MSYCGFLAESFQEMQRQWKPVVTAGHNDQRPPAKLNSGQLVEVRRLIALPEDLHEKIIS